MNCAMKVVIMYCAMKSHVLCNEENHVLGNEETHVLCNKECHDALGTEEL